MTHTKKVKKFDKLKVNDRATFVYLDETKITGRVTKRPKYGKSVELLIGRSWKIAAPAWAFVGAERQVSDLKPGDRVEIIDPESPNVGRRGTVQPVPDHRHPLSIAPYVEWDAVPARGKSKNTFFIGEDKLKKLPRLDPDDRFPEGQRVAYGSRLGDKGVVVRNPRRGEVHPVGRMVLVKWDDGKTGYAWPDSLVQVGLQTGDKVQIKVGAVSADGVYVATPRTGTVVGTHTTVSTLRTDYAIVEFVLPSGDTFRNTFRHDDLKFVLPAKKRSTTEELLTRLRSAEDLMSEMRKILNEEGK